MNKKILLTFLILFVLTKQAYSQEYSMDISGISNREYQIGSDLTFEVILLEDGLRVNKEVRIEMQDALERKRVESVTTSNQQSIIKIGEDFPGGIWTLKASYNGVEVERNFLVGENQDVEFLIEGDELVIRNKGNVRYTKTIQIKIGQNTETYAQNIRVGEEKRLKLVSPSGLYNIEVTDGTTTARKENVQLYGTGNVIGAVDKELFDYTGFASAAGDPGSEERFFSLEKLPLALIFVASVGVLTVLLVIERRLSNKVKSKKK